MSRSSFRAHLASRYPGPAPSPTSGGVVLPVRGPSPGLDAPPGLGDGPPSGARPGAAGAPGPIGSPPGLTLPEFKRADSIRPEAIVLPPLLVDGLLDHRGRFGGAAAQLE